MAYIGQGIKNGTFTVLDTSGNTYNGSNVTFSLGTQVGSAAQLLVSHDGVIQKPGTDYSLATGGTQITFSTAPASGASIFIVEISGAVGGPMNRDLDGDELVLDTDGDTSITADTDDQIDIKVAGTDQITIKDGALSPVTDNDIDLGTSSLEFKDAFFDGTVTTDGLTVSGTPSFADGSIAIADLDIDGGTDIGADIVDADLFIIDDGAGGTNRKTAASRIKSYVGGGTHVQTGTAFNTSNAGTSVSLSNCFSSTYDFYVIHFYFHFANNTSALRFRVLDSGGERSESQYQYSSRMFESNGSGGSHSGESADYIEIINSGSAGYDDGGVHGILHVHLNNGHGTTSHSNTLSMAGFYKSSPDNSVNRVRAYYHASNYIDTITNHTATGFNFYSTSGNLEFCNVKVYGLDGSSS